MESAVKRNIGKPVEPSMFRVLSQGKKRSAANGPLHVWQLVR
jgi:hypothetical protein